MFKLLDSLLQKRVISSPLPEQPCPHLHTHDPEDEEDKEAEEEDIAEHGEGVQQQHHKDPHTFTSQVCLPQRITLTYLVFC